MQMIANVLQYNNEGNLYFGHKHNKNWSLYFLNIRL